MAEADQVRHLVDGDLPSPSYSQDSHQRAGRRGINLPWEKNNIKDIYKLCDGMRSFKSALAEKGYDIKKGNKDGIYIIEKDGVLIGSTNRLLSMKKEIFKKEYEDATSKPKEKLRFNKANYTTSDIQPSQKISPEHSGDNRTFDGAASRRITDSADIGTTPRHSESTKNVTQNVRTNSKNTSFAVAKARINSSAGISTTKIDSQDKTAEAEGIRAGNAVIQQWKDIERLYKEIDEYFKNLEKMNKINNLSKEKFLKKSAIKNVNSYLKGRYDILKNRPKVRGLKDIKAELENKPFSEYQKAKQHKEKCEEHIKELENKKYSFFGFIKKSFKEDKKRLAELKENLSELSKRETDKSHNYDVKLRVSYDEAKAQQDKQKQEQEDYDKKHDIKKVRDEFNKLKEIKNDINNNDKNIIEDINNGELKNILLNKIQKEKDSQLKEQEKNFEQRQNKIESEASLQMRR